MLRSIAGIAFNDVQPNFNATSILLKPCMPLNAVDSLAFLSPEPLMLGP